MSVGGRWLVEDGFASLAVGSDDNEIAIYLHVPVLYSSREHLQRNAATATPAADSGLLPSCLGAQQRQGLRDVLAALLLLSYYVLLHDAWLII